MSNCNDFFTQERFVDIYNGFSVEFKHIECEALRCWYTLKTNTFKREDALIYRYQVLDTGRSILNHECCAEHGFLGDKKIVKIIQIGLNKSYRGKGYLRTFFEKSLEIFKEKGYSIITLDAINDGIVVWPRLGFQFANKADRVIINTHLKNYLTKYKKSVPGSIDIATVKAKNLINSKLSFSQYLQHQPKFKNYAVPMYYEIL